jgi:TnpA family transposase
MARGGEFLTSKERKEYMKLPNNVASFETEKFFMLSDDDIKVINKHRKASSKLGFAVQLCIIRYGVVTAKRGFYTLIHILPKHRYIQRIF